MIFAALVVAGYLVGSCPWGYWLPLLFRGEDVRRHGSGSIGGSNVWRTYGRTLAIPVIALDALKGFAPALVGVILVSHLCGILAGAAAMLGHARPLYLRFEKGGKMVATGGGVDLILSKNFAWRVAQLDYYMTNFSGIGVGGNARQDNFRAGTGLVYRWDIPNPVPPPAPNRPPVAACSVNPTSVYAGSGDTVAVHVSGSDPDNDPLNYSYSATVHHDVLDGSADIHDEDDVCPRDALPGGIDSLPPPKGITDKGCGAKKPDRTLGAPVVTNVVL